MRPTPRVSAVSERGRPPDTEPERQQSRQRVDPLTSVAGIPLGSGTADDPAKRWSPPGLEAVGADIDIAREPVAALSGAAPAARQRQNNEHGREVRQREAVQDGRSSTPIRHRLHPRVRHRKAIWVVGDDGAHPKWPASVPGGQPVFAHPPSGMDSRLLPGTGYALGGLLRQGTWRLARFEGLRKRRALGRTEAI